MPSNRERLGDEQRSCNACEFKCREEDQYPCKYCFAEDNHPHFKAHHSEQREQQIAEKLEEIAWLMKQVPLAHHWDSHAAYKRILAVLEAQLAELQKGGKG